MNLGLENLTTTGINYHLKLQGESVENFIILVELRILVKECANTSYEARWLRQKDFASQQMFYHLKLLLKTSEKLLLLFIKSSYLILSCETKYGTTE